MYYVALGRRVRKVRHLQGLTQEQLARKASLETLIRLANALDIGANDLLADSLSVMRGGVDVEGDERKARMVSAIMKAIDDADIIGEASEM